MAWTDHKVNEQGAIAGVYMSKNDKMELWRNPFLSHDIVMWQMPLRYNTLTFMLSKSDGWLSFKIWRVTLSWILGTHVDP